MNDLERYTRRWGATAVPFGPLSDTQWMDIPSQQRALTVLHQTAALRGVMLLSSCNGVGKSSLVGRWVRQLESRLFTPVNLTQATLSSSGLLASLARGLGKQPSMRRERNLEEVRLLLGLNLPSQPTFALILIGDEYLLGQLQLRNHRALCSRLSAHHMLSPWTLEEIQTYLTTGLEAVGIHRSKVFEPAAVDLLVRATAGVPRSVCLLARAAWLGAARAEAREISAQTMQLALEQVPGLVGL